MEFLLTILIFGAPVLYAALGELVGQKSGVVNIGLEGTMLLSAFTAVDISGRTGNPWLGLIAAITVGIVVSLFQAAFTVKWAADQVVVGTAVNLFALGLTATLYQVTYGATGSLIQVPSLPKLVGGTTLPLLLLPLLVAGVAFGLFRTRYGLALRAAGEYPPAVESTGFSVTAIRIQAQAINGVFVGLAGGYLTLALTPTFAENMTAGRGFLAIAIVTFGRWRPWWVLAAGLLVAGAESMQYLLQSRSVPLPDQLFRAAPYLVALAVLVIAGRGTSTPAALGRPFQRAR